MCLREGFGQRAKASVKIYLFVYMPCKCHEEKKGDLRCRRGWRVCRKGESKFYSPLLEFHPDRDPFLCWWSSFLVDDKNMVQLPIVICR
jgi:hypothetical protein